MGISFDGHGLSRGFLRAFCGELGDKTFFLTLILAAWCPIEGATLFEPPFRRQLVFCGVFCGLSGQAILLASIADASWASWVQRSWVWEVASGFVLALLALRACWLSAVPTKLADPDLSAPPTAPSAAPTAVVRPPRLAAEPWFRKDSLASPVLPMADNYGSVDLWGDGLFSKRMSSQTASAVVAFLLTAPLVLAVEQEDKAWLVLVKGGRRGLDEALGAIFGFAAAALVAVLMGYLMWCHLQTESIRLVAVSALLSLSLVSFSQALLHLSVLQPGLAVLPAR